MIRFTMRNLWNAVWKTPKSVNHASEMGSVGIRDSNVLVCGLHGLGFGSTVTVVVRLDEGLDRSGSLHR
jgi:hypothetical protein